MRHAEPGEFSRRAFLNGRMDLTAAEGLADLIASETEAQRRQALRQMEGSLGSRYEGWRTSLIGALAHIEAALDFTDQDLPEGLAASARDTARGVAAEIKSHLDDSHNGERLRDGVQVAVVGPPNAGKSSLVNSLARRDVAIVSDIPGTTRDVIEIHLDLAGVPVTVADTAGLRNADDSIEKEGVRRARLQAVNADLVVAIFDAAATDASDALQWPDIPEDAIFVANKIDLTDDGPGGLSSDRLVFGVSCLTGMGLDKLLGEVTARSAELIGEGAGPTRARHRAALTACVDAIDRVKAVDEPELIAEDLRIAAQALGRLTGRVDVEDILDVIFAEFCIGK
jgi:tRNA modification GTPase